MFYYLEGLITELEPGAAVVDCNGVGYYLMVSNNTLSALSVGKKGKLFISESIGESNFDLYGFADKAERACFEKLIAVSGVGPKAAIAVLNCNTPDSLLLAVATGNEAALTAAAGIGKKTAQRIILELKDKLNIDAIGVSTTAVTTNNTPKGAGNTLEAISALTALGYSANEVNAVLKNLDTTGLSSEQIVRQVLKQMI